MRQIMAVVQNGRRAGLNLVIPLQKGLTLTREFTEGNECVSVSVTETSVIEVCVVMKFRNTARSL